MTTTDHIIENYNGDEEDKAYFDAYTSYGHPAPSWEFIIDHLYRHKSHEKLEMLREKIPSLKGKCLL